MCGIVTFSMWCIFLICTLKNCKNKRIFVSNKNVLPGAEPEATDPVDRHHGAWLHGTKYGTRYTFGIVRSASNKIDKLAPCCKSDHLNIEKDVLMD